MVSKTRGARGTAQDLDCDVMRVRGATKKSDTQVAVLAAPRALGFLIAPHCAQLRSVRGANQLQHLLLPSLRAPPEGPEDTRESVLPANRIEQRHRCRDRKNTNHL